MRPGASWGCLPSALQALPVPGTCTPYRVTGERPAAGPGRALPGHPVTYDEAICGNLPGQEDRYRELAQRDALARAIAIGRPGGTISPAGMSARRTSRR